MTLLHQVLDTNAKRFPDAPFLDDERVGAYSLSESFSLIKQTASLLFNAGLRPGDAVVLKTTRSAATAIFFYAAWVLGIILIPIDGRNDASALWKLDPRVKAIAYQKDEANDIRRWTIEFQDGEALIEIPRTVDFDCDFETKDYDDEADCLWVFTSGSEGQSKIVRHCQRSLIAHCKRYHGPSSSSEKDRGVALLPFYHVFGIALLLMAAYIGFSLFFPATLDLDYVIDYMIEKEITYLDHVPTYHYAVAKRVQERGIRFHSLRNGVTGGAPMPESRFKEIETSLGMNLLPIYGASEIIGVAALGEDAPAERRRNAVGQPLEGTDILILDENGDTLPVNREGEIIVRSSSLMLGYLGEESGIDENGFFHTGDIGYLDEIGDLHISGRKKAILIRNGNNISCAEIERRLLEIEGVGRCAVIDIPDEEAGEAPGLMAELSRIDKEALEEAIRRTLPKPMWPTKIIVVKTLPILPSGKLDRVAIKEALCSRNSN